MASHLGTVGMVAPGLEVFVKVSLRRGYEHFKIQPYGSLALVSP